MINAKITESVSISTDDVSPNESVSNDPRKPALDDPRKPAVEDPRGNPSGEPDKQLSDGYSNFSVNTIDSRAFVKYNKSVENVTVYRTNGEIKDVQN